jgi:hypothetical protein
MTEDAEMESLVENPLADDPLLCRPDPSNICPDSATEHIMHELNARVAHLLETRKNCCEELNYGGSVHSSPSKAGHPPLTVDFAQMAHARRECIHGPLASWHIMEPSVRHGTDNPFFLV